MSVIVYDKDGNQELIQPGRLKHYLGIGYTTEPVEAKEEVNQDQEIDLNKLKKSELLDYCKESGIEADDSLKKSELIELIEKSQG